MSVINSILNRDLIAKYRLIAELVPYANHALLHSPAQIKKLQRSLKKFGWTQPLIIDAHDNLICGHGRLEAARLLGETMVPVISLGEMSEADRRAYIIADNKLAEEASWSKALLRAELSGLVELGYDVELTGFDTFEIDSLLRFGEEEPEPAREELIELPPEGTRPVSRVGDLWTIGRHRLYVGDARDSCAYDALMAGELAELIFCDPPYGCAIAGNVSSRADAREFVMGCDGVGPELSHGLLRPAFRAMRAVAKPGAIAFVFMDWRGLPALQDAVQGVFHETKNLIVWKKSNAGLGAFYRSAYELIYAYKVSPGPHINNFGLRHHRSNIWEYPGANTFRKGRSEDLADHPTIKNSDLVADAILDTSKPGGIVLDPFAGSGTTLVAAARTSRRGYAIELDPLYADVILRRVGEATGAEPLLGGETSLAEVAAARKGEDL